MRTRLGPRPRTRLVVEERVLERLDVERWRTRLHDAAQQGTLLATVNLVMLAARRL